MIESHFLCPAIDIMALTTAVPELPLVRVLLTVTPRAGHRRERSCRRNLVTGCTFNGVMRPEQRKARVLIVIEPDLSPGRLLVTITTIGTEKALVLVILTVAINAPRGRRPRMDGLRVAGFAFRGFMLAQQRKAGGGMIEGHLIPLVRRVAAGAVRPVLPLMHIV